MVRFGSHRVVRHCDIAVFYIVEWNAIEWSPTSEESARKSNAPAAGDKSDRPPNRIRVARLLLASRQRVVIVKNVLAND